MVGRLHRMFSCTDEKQGTPHTAAAKVASRRKITLFYIAGCVPGISSHLHFGVATRSLVHLC